MKTLVSSANKMENSNSEALEKSYTYTYIHSFCAIAGTLSGYRERLSPHHQDGSTTKGNERDNLYQTQLNRVTTASKQ